MITRTPDSHPPPTTESERVTPYQIKLYPLNNQKYQKQNDTILSYHSHSSQQQKRPYAKSRKALKLPGGPNEIRTRVVALKGRCPGPLDDGTA